MSVGWSFLGVSQFGEKSPLTLRTVKYSYGKMVYLNASCYSLGESG